MTNLDSIFKSRDIPLPTKVRLEKAMVFPVVIYGCESRTVKKAEHRRIDAFFFYFFYKQRVFYLYIFIFIFIMTLSKVELQRMGYNHIYIEILPLLFLCRMGKFLLYPSWLLVVGLIIKFMQGNLITSIEVLQKWDLNNWPK